MSALAAIFFPESASHGLAHAFGMIGTESGNRAEASFGARVELALGFLVGSRLSRVLREPGACCLLQNRSSSSFRAPLNRQL